MTSKAAVNRLMVQFKAGEIWRGYFEDLVYRMTDGASSLDMETYKQIEQYLRNLT